jgi:ketosteroid isomerase-like protein
MKSLLRILLIFGVALFSASQPALGRKASISAHQAVVAVNRAWVEAFSHCDISALSNITADDCIITNEYGQAISKAQFLEIMESQEPEDCKSDLSITGVRVQTFGPTSIVTGLMTEKQGKKSASLRYTNVFVRRKGQWKLVTTQLTNVLTATLEIPRVIPPK